MLLVLAAPLALAEPWDDPSASALRAAAQDTPADVFLGDGLPDPRLVARRLLEVQPGPAVDAAARRLAPELASLADPRPRLVVSGDLGLAVGTLDPVNHGGREEPGLLTPTATPDARLYWGPLTVVARPELALDVAPTSVTPRVDEAWVRVGGPPFELGFGARDRWLGPAHRGPLTLSDNAAPAWTGWLAGEGRLPGAGDALGRFRGRFDLGWLGRPRTDVTRPGFLTLDLRWMPTRWIEVGATRMSLFGGVGRPPVDVGQLLLPTEPHVYEDPDLSEPDQDELAAVDLRLTLPARRWWGLPVDHVSGWWQYGGEDVIARTSAGVKYPALAGVANVYGAEVAVNPFRVEVEYARLMDDYFRWYVGHRVYHEGFTQDGRPMGAYGGTDSARLWGALGVDTGTRRARLGVEHLRRVAVIEALNDRLFAFGTDERHWRVELQGGTRLRAGWLDLALATDAITGVDFVPDARALRVRAAATWTPARWDLPLRRDAPGSAP